VSAGIPVLSYQYRPRVVFASAEHPRFFVFPVLTLLLSLLRQLSGGAHNSEARGGFPFLILFFLQHPFAPPSRGTP